MADIADLVARQRAFYNGGNTLPVAWRKAQLLALRSAIVAHTDEICAALKDDLNKSEFESQATEITIVLESITYTLKHLDSWAKPRRKKHPITQFPGKSYVLQEPFGLTLIMSPWNYPINLTLCPLVGAIAAGNCAILKPSEYSPATSALMETIIAETFPPEYIACVTGAREESEALLAEHFDFIFYTGGENVGKIVMTAAAKHLTPVCLELGGKSPVIIDETADIPLTARRIAWGKTLNAGQTCIAPDYVLVQNSIKDDFVAALQTSLTEMWGTGEAALTHPDFPKIITDRHFNRLQAFINGSDPTNGTIWGGTADPETRRMEPTLLIDAQLESPVMSEEIFGPILPILGYETLEDAMSFVRSRPRPLALYLFSNHRRTQKLVTGSLNYGGGCVNDVISHIATTELPFGGIGNSGMGAYHGKDSFTIFSHAKGVMYKSNWFDMPLRYPPYTSLKTRLLQRFVH